MDTNLRSCKQGRGSLAGLALLAGVAALAGMLLGYRRWYDGSKYIRI